MLVMGAASSSWVLIRATELPISRRAVPVPRPVTMISSRAMALWRSMNSTETDSPA